MITNAFALSLLASSALAVSCGPMTPREQMGCKSALLPYQYEVNTADDHYFATLIPLDSSNESQTFFLSESSEPLEDENSIKGGDPAGRVVIFEQVGQNVVTKQFDLSLQEDSPGNNVDKTLLTDHVSGVIRFDNDGARYALASCDGVFSKKFKKDFPHLFD